MCTNKKKVRDYFPYENYSENYYYLEGCNYSEGAITFPRDNAEEMSEKHSREARQAIERSERERKE